MSRYIDADKIHEFVNAKIAEGKDGWAKGVPYEWACALTVIDNAPTADVVEVRHGHWKYLWLDAVCSECGYINEADAVTRCRSDPPYCPKCGAKMKGERRENTK